MLIEPRFTARTTGNHPLRPLARFCTSLLALLAALAPPAAALAAEPQQAVGVVFDDKNANAALDADEPGVPDVRVSNGRDVVKTDRDGRYRLPVTDDTILFVIKPRGWMTPVSEDRLPRFYYIHKPAGSPPNAKSPYPAVAPTGPLPASVDFPLRKHDEPARFDALIFGDTQPDNLQEIGYLAHDIVEETIGTPAAFGVTLGDDVNEKLDLYEPYSQVLAQIGVPWYNVIGNHDRNYFAGQQQYFDETFERVFGPSTYAFEYGPVHFLVLFDIQTAGDEKYVAGLGEQQLTFIASYLKDVPRDDLLVVMAHIPIGELPDAERRQLFDLLEPRPNNLVLTAHYHHQEHVFFGPEQGWHAAQPLHELINVTTCGSWWRGPLDAVGLPFATMSDGAPNGYSIITFDGNRYSIRYKAARRPADYQMNIFAPDEVAAGQTAQTEVLVNVFAGSAKSVVEMQLDGAGAWQRLEQVKQPDPYYVQYKEREKSAPEGTRKLPKAGDCPHLWRGVLPAGLTPGTHTIRVRTTDMFNQTYTAARIIRVAAGDSK